MMATNSVGFKKGLDKLMENKTSSLALMEFILAYTFMYQKSLQVHGMYIH